MIGYAAYSGSPPPFFRFSKKNSPHGIGPLRTVLGALQRGRSIAEINVDGDGDEGNMILIMLMFEAIVGISDRIYSQWIDILSAGHIRG